MEALPFHGKFDLKPGKGHPINPLGILLVGRPGVLGEHAQQAARCSSGTWESRSGGNSTTSRSPRCWSEKPPAASGRQSARGT